jgi:NADPH-dependent 2,4-dienoyl-CoA reductase/sulfur reductase-like enzyme
MRTKGVRPLTAHRAHVVVIGGGYSGALAANRLQQNADIDITVINARPVFVERIRLHQLVAGSGDATIDLAGMLGENVRLIVDTAERIDVDRRIVELASGNTVPYDCVIYAVGSTGSVPASIPGAREILLPHRGTRTGPTVARCGGQAATGCLCLCCRRRPHRHRSSVGVGRTTAHNKCHAVVRRRPGTVYRREGPSLGPASAVAAGS